MKSFLFAISGTSLLAVAATLSCYVAVRVTVSSPERVDARAAVEENQTHVLEKEDNTARSPRSKIYYAAIVERPLFAPERRPITPQKTDAEQEAVVVVESTPSSERPAVSLHGVMVDTNGRKALISAAEASPEWAELGAKVNGWTVSDIGSNWVELKLATETFRFEMY
ncbi:hypothetical protein [Ruegeria arenilitoris]|uniref:hypothetical protein n=1 Tax=Ruegeria arenilitoris TaxID=1173585 RepID=UPI0014804F48|nr:hypothetical protein [Ruegeria arenilitoris]